MRCIVGLGLLILGFATLLCRVEVRSASDSVGTTAGAWVRTSDGWERPNSWRVAAEPPPRPHPFVVAAGQGLVSVLALLALDGRDKRGRVR